MTTRLPDMGRETFVDTPQHVALAVIKLLEESPDFEAPDLVDHSAITVLYNGKEWLLNIEEV